MLAEKQNLFMKSYPSMRRRFGAIAYDWLLCLACIFVFTGILVTVNKGAPISASQKPFFIIGILLIVVYYFVGFWWHGGQTPGMKVWYIKLMSDVNPPRKSSLYLRFFCVVATFGLTFLSGFSNKERRCLHDTLSKTHLILNKPSKTK